MSKPDNPIPSILEGIYRLGNKRGPAHMRLDALHNFRIRQFVLALYRACQIAKSDHKFFEGMDTPVGRLLLLPFAKLFPIIEGEAHEGFRKPALRLLALNKKRRQRRSDDADEYPEKTNDGDVHKNSSRNGVMWRHHRYMRGRRPARRGLSGIEERE